MSSNGDGLTMYQASIAVVNLFIGVEVPLLFFIKSDSNFHENTGSDAKQALLMLAYSALFFSLSAAVSGFILTYMQGKKPAQIPQASRGYEASHSLTWAELHWILSLIGATVLPIAQILLYVWLEESNSVRITLSAITAFAVLPLVHLIPTLTASFWQR